MDGKERFPAVSSSDYESVNVPGLHFTGNLAHSLDYKSAAGGFVHGFRYTARALARILLERDGVAEYPSKVFSADSSATSEERFGQLLQVKKWFQKRVGEASGPYQMFDNLFDVCIFMNRTSLEAIARGNELSEDDADDEAEEKFGEQNFRVLSEMRARFWYIDPSKSKFWIKI